MIELAPSILSADFAHLADAANAAVQGGATVIHCDVMDGRFVPNLTIGPPVVASLRKAVDVPLDCHLMVENPDEFIPAFADAGANWIPVARLWCTARWVAAAPKRSISSSSRDSPGCTIWQAAS
ncbi:MAG TPA: hypothetical protein VII29_02560, partial [Terriglobales bacterium]